MKKVLALLLCLTMLLTVCAGCKKTAKNTELTDALVRSDLVKNSNLYTYAHLGIVNSISSLKIADKNRDGDVTTLSVTGTALSSCAKIQMAADMKYTFKNGAWHLDSMKVNKAVPTLTAGPYTDSVLSEISNYLVNNESSQKFKKPSALAVKNGKYHNIELNVQAADWQMAYDALTQTAKLNVTYKSENLSFSGYYSLEFDAEKGWIIHGEQQENGQNYLLLYLNTLEQKASKK